MTTYPDPAVLYPDVAARGGLAAALEAVAEELGIALGQVEGNERQPLHSASVSSSTPLRQSLGVMAGAVERCWVITGWGQGIWLIGGSTGDLADVVRAAWMWREGVALPEIRRAVPFVRLTRLAEAAEQGPAQVVAVQWRLLREAADGAPWAAEQRALIDAAYAEPKLRRLYPYTSHWILCFSTTTGYPFSPPRACVEVVGSGQFRVRTAWNGGVPGSATTAEEAVSLLVSHLPGDVGPAVAGAYH